MKHKILPLLIVIGLVTAGLMIVRSLPRDIFDQQRVTRARADVQQNEQTDDQSTSCLPDGYMIYRMTEDDKVTDRVPQDGDIELSSNVLLFLEEDVDDHVYLPVRLQFYMETSPFIGHNEYVYQGRTVMGWKNDPLFQRYDDYVKTFKEENHQSADYQARTAKGEWDQMYRAFLESIADDANQLAEVIMTYDLYWEAVAAYEQARIADMEDQKADRITGEVDRWLAEGLDIRYRVVDNGNIQYKIVVGLLNQEQIRNLSLGVFGYKMVYDVGIGE